MDMNSRKSDAKKAEQGDWIDGIPQWGDLRLKVRGFGNSDYRRLQSKLLTNLSSKKQSDDVVDPDESDRVTVELLIKTILQDWENVTIDGVPVPYSEDQARQFIADPDYRSYSLNEVDFRAAVISAANRVAVRGADCAKDALGNSSPPSDGGSNGGQETSQAATSTS